MGTGRADHEGMGGNPPAVARSGARRSVRGAANHRRSSATSATLIPHVFHRIWLGGGTMPEGFVALGETWLAHHPDWDCVLWTEENLPALRNQEQFDAATSQAQRADILRYEILHRDGGVYVDTDFECLKPIDRLLDGVEAFIASENGLMLSIGIMGAIPRHPFFDAVIRAIPASLEGAPAHRAPNETTGPHLVTRVHRDCPEVPIAVFGPELFYPYLYNESYRRDEPFPDAYAVHHWNGAWLTEPGVDVPARYRVVVATDFTRPAHAEAMATEFARLFSPTDPVELAFAVPHQVSQDDLDNAVTLLRGARVASEKTAPLRIDAFQDAAAAPFDVALVPAGDDARLIRELATAVGALHRLRALIDKHGRPALAASREQPVLAGNLAALRDALARFSELPPAPAPARDESAVQVAAHRATYVGANRLLVSTNWGGKLFMHANDLSITPEVVHDGNYDDPLTNFIVRVVRPGDVVFDVGANIGLFTLLMAQAVGPSGRVVAYEAAPENAALLRDTIAMNYQTAWVDIREAAAAASAGTRTFHACTRFMGNGSLLAPDEEYARAFLVDGGRELTVAAEPLDVHLGAFERIALVKIDVEGGEEQVLAGMQGLTDAGAVERICLELLRSRMGDDWEAISRRLVTMTGAGWKLSLLGEHGEQLPIDLGTVLEHGRYSQLLLQRPGIS